MSEGLLHRGRLDEWNMYCTGKRPYTKHISDKCVADNDEYGVRMLFNIMDTYVSVFNGGFETHIAMYSMNDDALTVYKQVELLKDILELLKSQGHTTFTFIDGTTSTFVKQTAYSSRKYDYELYFFMNHGTMWYEKNNHFENKDETYEILKQIRIQRYSHLFNESLEYFNIENSSIIRKELNMYTVGFDMWKLGSYL